MPVDANRNFICPLDQKPLELAKAIYHCENGHSYDLAKEGYCNLLLVQNKASLDPGDNKEMVAARSRFLNTGAYDPIAEKLVLSVQAIAQYSAGNLKILDAGCGDGFYLKKIADATAVANPRLSLSLVGTDISKWAVKAAAKRDRNLSWAVASNRRLPFAPKEMNLILSLFGFPDWQSFTALLQKEGRVLLVDPAPDHLIELRKVIYPTVNETSLSSIAPALESGFQLEREEELRFSLQLTKSEDIVDLLAMTPHGFRITDSAKATVDSLSELSVTVAVVFRTLRKTD